MMEERNAGERIVVVGGGSMGSGIAAAASRSGYAVTLVEPDASARERALQRAPFVQVVESLPYCDAEIAIEAVPERMELKRTTFADMSERISGAVLATNTSSLSVGEIAAAAADPARVLGLHFFNPPERMQLVEIVRQPHSAAAALERARRFVDRLGKTGIVTADSPGFVVNRVARPYYLQAMRALDASVASIEEMDALARAAGFRMGPFELMDFIGLDVNLATSESIFEATSLDRLEPVTMQRALVTQGRLGRKSGSGFYSYDGTPPKIDLRREPSAGVTSGERAVVLGGGTIAEEIATALSAHFCSVNALADDEQLSDLAEAPTILVDTGDGSGDRTGALLSLDAELPPECVLFGDAYTVDLDACAKRAEHPERIVGYGILGSLERQRGVEIVDADATSDDALALAQEMFEATGRGVVLVENVPGLFLGRVIGSIVNEAVAAVDDAIASAEDVDLAMRLGTNYPVGPIAWGREIGGRRIARILRAVAERDGPAFGPQRALWVLDVQDGEVREEERSTDT